MGTVMELLGDRFPTAPEGVGLAEGRFEIIGGVIRSRPDMGAEADWIATLLSNRMHSFVTGQALGWVFGSSCGYQVFQEDLKRVRYPDGSFIRAGRLPDNRIPRGHVRIVPDLAFEVVSPNDNAYDVEERLDDLLSVGTRRVWIIYPSTRHIMVYRPGPRCTRLHAGDVLDGEDVLPGFACPVTELFPAAP